MEGKFAEGKLIGEARGIAFVYYNSHNEDI